MNEPVAALSVEKGGHILLIVFDAYEIKILWYSEIHNFLLEMLKIPISYSNNMNNIVDKQVGLQ